MTHNLLSMLLKKKYSNIAEPKKSDICYATTNRQNAVKKIAANCDLFIVIGAYNSSNSLRLVEVAKMYGAKESILIENASKFDISLINGVHNIGITASASAPEILVQNFIKFLKENFTVTVNEPQYIKENINFKIPQQLNVAD